MKLEQTKVNKHQEVKGKAFDEERSLYNLKNATVTNCKFSGAADGESPLKESRNVKVNNSIFDLRYAFWHVSNSEVEDCKFSSSARAPFWYDNFIKVTRIESEAVKVFRECRNIGIFDSTIISEEPFWRCTNLRVKSSKLVGFYAFFQCRNITIQDLNFTGKYSFQYNQHLLIENSNFDTKDAFWHCNDVEVKNSIIKGEYIGWYSKNMTFINCTIESHQPFCYSKNIKFIDCKMINCDLAFENSTVSGNIIGEIESIKNPILCNLKVGKVKKIIREDSLHKVSINITKDKKKS